ncbi:hypothetical protein [Undibacterium terreum]|uniref:Uncharacterized protein n=1 Tax=Undibacterium terreum TaxID=1224302 RepID=A0A916V0Z7_9BURK|nr:hypothetical protein [Undibacterium terreum]GGD00719.1 hypothetical protein GCM10011396_55360 [Undibacterium terreum]
MFELNKDYSRENIHQTVGGNKESFLPASRGKIVAACLRPDLNPRAPEYIVCNSGAAARASGFTLSRQIDPVPVFIRQDSDRYRFVGHFVVQESYTTQVDCAPFAQGTGFTSGQISRVIKMTPHK